MSVPPADRIRASRIAAPDTAASTTIPRIARGLPSMLGPAWTAMLNSRIRGTDHREFVRQMLSCSGLLKYSRREDGFRTTARGRRMILSPRKDGVFSDPELLAVRWSAGVTALVLDQIERFYIKTDPVALIRDRLAPWWTPAEITALCRCLEVPSRKGVLSPAAVAELLVRLGYQRRHPSGKGVAVTAAGARFGKTRRVKHRDGSCSFETRWSTEVVPLLREFACRLLRDNAPKRPPPPEAKLQDIASMKGAIRHFNRQLRGCAGALSLKALREAPRGQRGKNGWAVFYSVTRREGRPVLAYYTHHRMTNDQYREISAEGECIYGWSSSDFLPGSPEGAVEFWQHELEGHSRAKSAGIPVARESLDYQRRKLRAAERRQARAAAGRVGPYLSESP